MSHIHVLDLVVCLRFRFFDLCITHPELIFSKSLGHSLFAAALLNLVVQIVDGLASAGVVVERISEEIVAFQHLGAAHPFLLVTIIRERIIRVNLVGQLVFLQPSQLSPFFGLFIGHIVISSAPHFVHQQGTNGLIAFPRPVRVTRVEAQAGIHAIALYKIEGDIFHSDSTLVGSVELLRVVDKLLIGTSSKQCSHHRCRE